MAVGLSAAVAPLVDAHPVGSDLLDWIWSAALAGLGAFLAVRSKRGPLLVVAVVAVVSARSGVAIALGSVAVVAAALSTRHLRRRAVFSRGIAGGAAVISVLATTGDASAPHLLAAATILAVTLGASGYAGARSSERRWLRRSAALGIVAAVAASVGAAVGVIQEADLVDAGTAELEAGLAAARTGDAQGAAEHLARARTALSSARRGIDRWGVAGRLVPITAQHVSAVAAVLEDVERATSFAAQAAVIADTEALEVTAGTVDLDALRDLESPLTRLADSLGDVIAEVDDRADGPLLPPLVDRLDRLREEATRARREAALGADAAAVLPAVLGGDGERRYLVLFTSPAEARGRFGLPASFAEVSFVDGRMRLGEHGSTSETFLAQSFDQERFDVGSDQARPYLPFGVTRLFLSTTVPPDFPTVAGFAAEMWAQSGRPPIDGVVRMDPASLAPLLAFLGEVSLEELDQPLTAANLEQFLLVDQYVQFPNRTAPRRELLSTVADITFERLEVGNLPAPRRLFDAYGPLMRSGHIQMHAFEPRAASLFRDVQLSGRFLAPASDGLMVTSINGLGNKIDSFLTRTIRYTGVIEDGEARTSLVIELANGAPSSGLPLYVIGSFAEYIGEDAPDGLPVGTNRSTVLVYTVLPATEIRVAGVPTAALSQRSGGWWVHQVPVDIPSGGTVAIEIDLEGELDTPYSLVLEPGGTVLPEQAVVDLQVDDRTVGRDEPISARAVVR